MNRTPDFRFQDMGCKSSLLDEAGVSDHGPARTAQARRDGRFLGVPAGDAVRLHDVDDEHEEAARTSASPATVRTAQNGIEMSIECSHGISDAQDSPWNDAER